MDNSTELGSTDSKSVLGLETVEKNKTGEWLWAMETSWSGQISKRWRLRQNVWDLQLNWVLSHMPCYREALFNRRECQRWTAMNVKLAAAEKHDVCSRRSLDEMVRIIAAERQAKKKIIQRGNTLCSQCDGYLDILQDSDSQPGCRGTLMCRERDHEGYCNPRKLSNFI